MVIASGLWEHYRGGFYWVLFVALCSTNGPDEGRLMVVYMGCDVDGTPRPGPRPRTSTAEHFLETVVSEGRRVPRFTHRGPVWPPHHRDNRPFGRPTRQARRPARPTATVRSRHRDRHRSRAMSTSDESTSGVRADADRSTAAVGGGRRR
jgi:hypothetical protein